MEVIMRNRITKSYNRYAIRIYSVDADSKEAKALSTRIHASGVICLQIHRPELLLQATMILGRGRGLL